MQLKFPKLWMKQAQQRMLPGWYALRRCKDPSVCFVLLRDQLGVHFRAGKTQKHLVSVMNWLRLAQDATPDAGVAGAFDPVAGAWYPSYPETTGYIIPTFFNYASLSGDQEYRDRAVQMADWLLTLQLHNGAFPGPPWIEPRDEAVVFDTGQIIRGQVRTYIETGQRKYLDAARRAGEWLAKVQEEDGSWCANDMGHPHTYNTLTAYGMLQIDELIPSANLRSAAIKHLNWVLSCQASDGWFQCAAFAPGEAPLTHTLAYTIEGLMACGLHLSDEASVIAAKKAADELLKQMQPGGYLTGRFSEGWGKASSSSCLTGTAQMALIWFFLHKLTGDPLYLSAAQAANRFLKQVHILSLAQPGITGGVAGSYPLFGDYGQHLYLNWAAKFFADSLMEELAKQ